MRQRDARLVLVTSGVIVDASVTGSPRRPRWLKEYEMVEDCHEDEQADTVNAKLLGMPRPGVDTEAVGSRKPA